MNYLNIQLAGSDDSNHSLNDFAGKKIVLYFYPKDDTSGCTLEAKEFTSLKDEYSKKGYTIIGISSDSVASHKKFVKKHNLDILLLSDPDKKLIQAFGIWKEKSMYGKKYMGIERSTFLIDETGKTTREYRGVSPKNHAKIVLEEI